MILRRILGGYLIWCGVISVLGGVWMVMVAVLTILGRIELGLLVFGLCLLLFGVALSKWGISLWKQQ
jgi:hypothetical protein